MKSLRESLESSLNESSKLVADISNAKRKKDIENAVNSWFYDNCGREGYESDRERMKDLKYMADGDNDILVDSCVEAIFDDDIDDEVREYIVELLKDLASKEI